MHPLRRALDEKGLIAGTIAEIDRSFGTSLASELERNPRRNIALVAPELRGAIKFTSTADSRPVFHVKWKRMQPDHSDIWVVIQGLARRLDGEYVNIPDPFRKPFKSEDVIRQQICDLLPNEVPPAAKSSILKQNLARVLEVLSRFKTR